MATRKVRLWPDPVLSEKCAPVVQGGQELNTLVQDLLDTMYAANGRGLAAPQVGVLQQVFVVDVDWKEGDANPMVFINPKITALSDAAHEVTEQCLSIPDLPMPVTRPSEIDLTWENATGDTMSKHFTGNEARCILHELDHLSGIVIFDHQSREARAKLEASYAA